MSSSILLGEEIHQLLSEAMETAMCSTTENVKSPLSSSQSADFVRRCMALKARIKVRNSDPELSKIDKDLNNQRMTVLHNMAMLEASSNLHRSSDRIRLFTGGQVVLML